MSDLISRQATIDALANTKDLVDVTWTDENDNVIDSIEEKRNIIANWLEKVPSAQPERNGWVHIDDIYRLISGHSNYHGNNILAALTCLAEGKEVLKPITVLDAQPERKKGEWIRNDNGTYSCSACQSWIPEEQHYYARYCLYCGADMRGEQDE